MLAADGHSYKTLTNKAWHGLVFYSVEYIAKLWKHMANVNQICLKSCLMKIM